MYSQVNSIINQLGNEYISKLPKDIYEMIITSKDDNYTPNVDLTKSLRIQNISKEAVSIIAYFHIKYWSDLEEKNKMDPSFIKDVFIRQKNGEEFLVFVTEDERKYRFDTDNPEKIINLYQEETKNGKKITLNELGSVIKNAK